MKQFSFSATIAMALSMALFICSCNSGGEKTTTDTTVDTTKKMSEPAPPAKPGNVLVIMHKVANYAKWLPEYESHDSTRQAHGLTNYVIGRGIEDSNMLHVVLKMSDVSKAKELIASPEMKERMMKAGVEGKPAFEFIELVMLDPSTPAQTARLRVTHKVKDWDAWKKEFDGSKQARMDAGLVDRAIGHSVDDNHMVSVVFMITDMAKAKAFMNSQDLKDRMSKAGVEGPPTFFFYNVAKKY